METGDGLTTLKLRVGSIFSESSAVFANENSV